MGTEFDSNVPSTPQQSFYPHFNGGESAYGYGEQSLPYHHHPSGVVTPLDSLGKRGSGLGVDSIPSDYILQPIGANYLQASSYDPASGQMIPPAIQLQQILLPPAISFGQPVNANAPEGICQQ